MLGCFWNRNDEERQRVRSLGIADQERVFGIDALSGGKWNVFIAIGVTGGDFTRGVRFFGGGVRTHTLVMTAQRLLARFIDSTHISSIASTSAAYAPSRSSGAGHQCAWALEIPHDAGHSPEGARPPRTLQELLRGRRVPCGRIGL